MLNLRIKQILLDLNENRLLYLFSLIYKDIIDLNVENPYTEVDWFIPSKMAYIEAKCRSKHYDTLFIEKIKYDKLINYKNSWYVSSTPEGVWAWNIKKIKPIWIERKMERTQFFSNKRIVNKIVAQLPVEEAINLTDELIIKKLRKNKK
jgi:hypothetical protein